MITTSQLEASKVLVAAANKAHTNREINLVLNAVCSVVEYGLSNVKATDQRLFEAVLTIRAFASDRVTYDRLRVATMKAHAVACELGVNGQTPVTLVANALWRIPFMLGPDRESECGYRVNGDIVQTIVELVYRACPKNSRPTWCRDLENVAKATLADFPA